MQLSEEAVSLLKKYYMRPEEQYAVDAYRRAACCFSNGDKELENRIVQYAEKGWFMFASPVLFNAVWPGEKPRGLPISCFLSYVPDSLEGLIEHSKEVRWLSVKGGGVGGHWSEVRNASDISPGAIPFIKTIDSDMEAYRQGFSRKGSYAAYIDISHPDVLEFLNIRIPTGGDANRKCFNLHHAVNIPDAFMKAVEEGAEWEFVNPHTKEVVISMPARQLFQQLLEIRFKTGEPYFCFIDTANRELNPYLKAQGLRINGSNLCSEIYLPTNAERTAVCCLSSVNLEYYDEWKNTTMVQDLTVMLDNVLEFFIQHAPKELWRAVASAKHERSLGLGAMGYHAYLQKNMLSWNHWRAMSLNIQMFKHIKEQAVIASERMAKERGEPEGIKGSGRRNAHLLAIAPNANSSIILDTSPSIEPWLANGFKRMSRTGTFLVKNRYLEKVLHYHNQNTDDVWKSIITNKGSAQHLGFLTQEEKEVFKTAMEIDQHLVVEHAAARQPFICQGQSVNLFFSYGSDINYVAGVHIKAFKKGLKGLYYLRTEAGKAAETVSSKVERKVLKEAEACVACES